MHFYFYLVDTIIDKMLADPMRVRMNSLLYLVRTSFRIGVKKPNKSPPYSKFYFYFNRTNEYLSG